MPDSDAQSKTRTVVVPVIVDDPSPRKRQASTKNPKSHKRRTDPSAAPGRSPTSSVHTHDAPPIREISTSTSSTRHNDRAFSDSLFPTDLIDDVGRGSELVGLRSKRPRVSEVSGSTAVLGIGTSRASVYKHGAAGPVYRIRRPDSSVSVATAHRRSGRRGNGRVTKRNETVLEINPSLLSVLTSLTGISDQSSSSSTTITQESYDRRCRADKSMSPASRTRRSTPEQRSSSPTQWPTEPVDVFQYMHPPSTTEDDDDDVGESVATSSSSSSSSSGYEASDAGSSAQPDTPSSRSTFPSPTATRSGSINGHVAEMRRKYDAQSTMSTRSARSASVRSGSISPELAFGTAAKQPQVSEPTDMDCAFDPEHNVPEDHFDPRTRSSSRSSSRSRRSNGKLRQHEEAMHQHMAYAQHGQHVDPAYIEYVQQYMSTVGPAQEYPQHHYPPQMALQPYNYPSPPAQMGYPSPPHSMNGRLAAPDRPPAPDAPDLTKRTLVGYEKLAMELSNGRSSVKPIYRKFDYLNHRMLLHIQDELSELEEQLRTTDEIVAQMEAAPSPDVPRNPSSRREEASSIVDMHHRRTALLGRIFLKTEQYNRAMASFAAMNKECRPAEQDQVDAYRSWLAKHSPIHEDETRFLLKDGDLILPGLPRTPFPSASSPHSNSEDQKTARQTALTYLPFALMLPLLFFSLIPSFGGRLVVTALIAGGGSLVVNAAQMWDLMPINEWAICAGAYMLLMTAIAGCIPQHA